MAWCDDLSDDPSQGALPRNQRLNPNPSRRHNLPRPNRSVHISLLLINMPSEIASNPYANVTTADLFTVKFDNLFDRDDRELGILNRACERDGFFYLDLQGTGSVKLWNDLERLNQIMKSWFAQSDEDKLGTPTVSLAHGFVFCADLMRLELTAVFNRTQI